MKSIKKIRLNNNTEKYDFGGWVKDHALTAALGPAAMIADVASKGKFSNFLNHNGRTVGTVGGGIAGAALGNPMMGAQIGGQLGGFVQDDVEQRDAQSAQYSDSQRNSRFRMESTSNKNLSPNTNQNDMLQQIPYAKGGVKFKANAEFEKGEPYMTPDGKIQKISDNAPSHAQGGVPVNVPDGTTILGKNKIFNTEFKKLGSQLKTTQDKADKTLEDNSTALARSTAIRNLSNVQKKWNSLFSMQEMQKQTEQSNIYQYGGLFGDEKQIVYQPDEPSLREFNKKYKTNYTSFGDFTKYKFNKQDAEKDSVYLKAMLEDEDVNKDSTLSARLKLAEVQSQINSRSKYKFPNGGKKGKVLVYNDSGDGYDQAYSKKLDKDGKRIGQKYFYETPDSTFQFQGDSADYEASVYKPGKRPIVYSKDNKIPVDAWFRTTDAINKLQNTVTPEEYKEGGKIHIKPSKVGSLHSHLGVPQGEKIPASKLAIKSTDSPAIRKKKQFAINAAKWHHADGGMVKYPDGGTSPDWYNWMSTTDPDLNTVNNYIKSNPIGADGKTVSTNPNDIMNYWGQVRSGKNNYMGNNKWATGPALYNFSNATGNNINTTPTRSMQMTPLASKQATGVYSNAAPRPSTLSLAKRRDLIRTPNVDTNAGVGNTNYSDYAALGASVLPGLYNMGRSIFGKADKLNAANFQNPYEDQALSQLRDRKFDIDPLLSEIRTGNRIADYNAKNYGGSRAEMLNRQQGNVVNRNKAIAEAYTNKYNIENQYKGDYAQALLGVGANRANVNMQSALWNKQAQATKDNLFGQGLSQIGQSTMDYLKYRNQLRNDEFRKQAIKEGLQYYDLSKDMSLMPKYN